jgi:hypothetical protein
MKDVELVLRFFAFLDAGYKNYKKPMKRFLDNTMRQRRHLTEAEGRQLRQMLTRTISLVNTVFGDQVFRRYDASGTHGRWRPQPNIAFQDVIMYAFAKRLDQRPKIIKKNDLIRESLINILVKDSDFISSLETHASDEDRVKLRFRTWLAELDEILDGVDD